MKIVLKFHSTKSAYQVNSLTVGQNRSFIGDEMTAISLRKELLKLSDVEYCEILNQPPSFKPDIMVYFHEDLPLKENAGKSIAYLQRGFNRGSDKELSLYHSRNYDGYMFISKKLLELHKRMGFNGAYVPTAVDEEYMKPLPQGERYKYDVAYVGNDIKGFKRSMKYIYPARNFNFGLFGNWRLYSPFKDCLTLRGFVLRYFLLKYRRLFRKISQGQIAYRDLPLLYSSAKIILNCTHQDNVDWDVITGRTYDVLACNGFLISDEVPSAVERFSNCAVFTTGGRDLKKKISYYLQHSDERVEIAARGRETVLKSDTFRHRAVDMVDYFKKIL